MKRQLINLLATFYPNTDITPMAEIVYEYFRDLKLFKRDVYTIEPMDVDFTFETFEKFREFTPDPLEDGKVLLYWAWVPSFKKAQRYKIESLLESFDDLEEVDDYKEGADGLPHEDKSNYLVYKDHDYLLLYTHRIWNGFHTHSYKITVADEDEIKVKEFIDKMIKDTVKSWK